jgi:ubiquinol-cytochrome c reductase iron-sulfur subunit
MRETGQYLFESGCSGVISGMSSTTTGAGEAGEPTRRDFLYIAGAGIGAVGMAAAVWPFIAQMNPSADVLALSSIEVDISKLGVGTSLTVLWRGNPVFIRHRTPAEISRAVADDKADLKDPERDEDRTQKPEWLIMSGVCTHLGCTPLGQKGDYGGWFCPCHGSHYDTSGRIRKGPAPTNLPIPPYAFLSDTKIRIG